MQDTQARTTSSAAGGPTRNLASELQNQESKSPQAAAAGAAQLRRAGAYWPHKLPAQHSTQTTWAQLMASYRRELRVRLAVHLRQGSQACRQALRSYPAATMGRVWDVMNNSAIIAAAGDGDY